MPAPRRNKLAIETRVTSASSGTAASFLISSPSAARSSANIEIQRTRTKIQKVPDEVAEKAIYNHFRYLRSLGRETVDSDEIARALDLPISQVERVAERLRTRGVRVEG